LATLINPYGWTIYRFVGNTSTIAYQRAIAEWVAPGPDRLIGLVWLASVTGVFGLVGWRWLQTRRAPALRDVLILGCFFALSCSAVRMVAWWMLASAPLTAELLVWLAPKLADEDKDAEKPSLVAGAVFGLVVLAVTFSLPGLDRVNPLLGPTRRGHRVEEDLETVQRHLAATRATGNLYSHFEWGEYLSWSAAPRFKVFMDGRIDMYPDDVWEQYNTVTFGRPGWEQILDHYRVDYLILDVDLHGRTGLLERVARSPEWQETYGSRSARLYVRKKHIS
jgi:hypothetical protein